MALNKIAFAYVTVALPGMIPNSNNYLPQVLLTNADMKLSQLVIVTVGLFFSSDKPFALEADILFEGETVIDPTYSSDDKMKFAVYGEPEKGQTVTLCHLDVNGVNFKKSGIYQVRCNLAEDMEKLTSKQFVDTVDTFFYVGINTDEVANS